MSFSATQAAIHLTCRSHAQHLVLIYLADCYNHQTGKCCPSYETIAAALGMAKSTVARAIKESVEDGLIAKRKTQRPGTFEGPNHYRLLFFLNPRLSALEAAKVRRTYVRGDVPTIGPEPRSSPSLAKAREGERPAAPRQRSQRARPRRRLTEDWKPTAKQRADAAAKGLTDAQIDFAAEQFVNHHMAEGKVQADWSKKWHYWVNNEVKFKERDDERARTSSPGARGEQRFERMRSLHRAAEELSAERAGCPVRGRTLDSADEE